MVLAQVLDDLNVLPHVLTYLDVLPRVLLRVFMDPLVIEYLQSLMRTPSVKPAPYNFEML